MANFAYLYAAGADYHWCQLVQYQKKFTLLGSCIFKVVTNSDNLCVQQILRVPTNTMLNYLPICHKTAPIFIFDELFLNFALHVYLKFPKTQKIGGN